MPILIPLTVGMILILFRKNILLQRLLSVLAILAIGMVSIFLLNQIKTEGIQTLQLGGWKAPLWSEYGSRYVFCLTCAHK